MRSELMLLSGALVVGLACSSPSSPTPSTTAATTETTGTSSLPAMYARFQSNVTITVSGTSVVLKSNGLPDHASPYWGAGKALYEAPHAGMMVNPNLIQTQNLTFTVPIAPIVAGSPSDTPLGPMGIAVNGVALFNQYAAGRSPLANEILSFDRLNGHPQNTGVYHYHVEPLWLTSGHGPSSLIGVLLDGFPVYGPQESNGAAPSGLDTCNGHTHATPEAAAGIYHYHVTATAPYISGCFKGAPGSAG
jgi:hypothetical protein